MEDSVGRMEMGFRRDKTQKVIITLKEDPEAGSISESCQTGISMADRTENLTNDLASKNGRLKGSFDRVGVISAELPLSQIKELAKNPNVAYISSDRPIVSTGHIENATGALQSRGLVSGKTLDGTGIGVAVLDSGIDTYHKLNDSNTTHPGVVFTKNFTGVSATRDNYGHGTHVASIIAGDSPQSPFNSVSYRGVAPNAQLLNLRVLNQDGTGSVSNAVAAIDWAIANKAAYNIRVMNMSIGTAVIDSYKNDPLCLAARRAVNAGIVVVTGRKQRQGRERQKALRADQFTRHRAFGHHGRRGKYFRDRFAARRRGNQLQLTWSDARLYGQRDRSEGFRQSDQTRSGRAGQQNNYGPRIFQRGNKYDRFGKSCFGSQSDGQRQRQIDVSFGNIDGGTDGRRHGRADDPGKSDADTESGQSDFDVFRPDAYGLQYIRARCGTSQRGWCHQAFAAG